MAVKQVMFRSAAREKVLRGATQFGARSRRNPFVAALGGAAEAVAAALPCDVLLVPPFTAPSEVLASEGAQ